MTNLAPQRSSVHEHPELSVIIVNWNTRDLLRDCLNSIYAETRATSFEILVVDNASSDSSAEMVKREFPQAKLIENQENLGFAKANNQAIRQSSGRFILLLNSDTVVLSGALDKMVAFMKEHRAVDASGPMLLNPDGSLQQSTWRASGRFAFVRFIIIGRVFLVAYLLKLLLSKIGKKETYSPQPRQVGGVSGACMMITREAVDKVGLLDEQYFFFWEEVDWFYRLQQLGGVVYFIPEAQVIHHYAQSINQTDNRSKYLHENRYRFINKYHGKMRGYFFRIMLAIDSFFVICAFLLLQVLVRGDKRKEMNLRLRWRWRTLLWVIGWDKGSSNSKA